MTTLRETLTAARQVLIDNEWTQGGSFATDEDGRETYGGYGKSTCFCAVGAVQRVLGIRSYSDLKNATYDAATIALSRQVTGNIITFNDSPSTTKEDVLAVFDRAIEAAS